MENPSDNSLNVIALQEWLAIMERISSLDTILWQGAGVLLVLSFGGVSLIGASESESEIFTIFLAVSSILILIIWWFIFHRWLYLQSLYSFRAREIESKLGLFHNVYARYVEYHKYEPRSNFVVNFEKDYPSQAQELREFYNDHLLKRKFSRVTIRRSLECLTYLLVFTWIVLILATCIL